MYQRKQILLVPRAASPFNAMMLAELKESYPRLDFFLASPQSEPDADALLARIKDARAAGDSTAETRQLAEADYLVVLAWAVSPIALTGPHQDPSKEEKSAFAANENPFYLRAESSLELQATVFKVAGDAVTGHKNWTNTWPLARKIVLSEEDMNLIRFGIKKDTGRSVSFSSSADRDAILEYARTKHETLSQIPQKDPVVYMEAAVAGVMAPEGHSSVFGEVLSDITALEDFRLKGQIVSANMATGQIELTFGESESAASLGILVDAPYKVWVTDRKTEKLVEMGLIKVRRLEDKKIIGEPIIAYKTFEAGDQIIEYPKGGVGGGFRAGTTHVTLGKDSLGFVPYGGVDFEFNIGRFFHFPEFFGTFNIGMGLPAAGPSNPNVSVWTSFIEFGALKRFYLRQLIASFGLRFGGMNGQLWDSCNPQSGCTQVVPFGTTATNFTVGATALAGLHWQISPDLILGLDAGYRFYFPSFAPWKHTNLIGQERQLDFGAMGSNGPVFQLFVNYVL